MNLDLLALGWVHSVACLIALAAGPLAFGTRKGSPRHILSGRVYVLSMVVLNLSALGIYRLGVFFFPHMLAALTLALVAVGWASARFHWPRPLWRHLHLSTMIGSYYLLIGGAVNEAYLRIESLRQIANREGPQVIGLTHGVVMLAFLVLLLGWNAVEIARTLSRRPRPLQGA